MYEMFNPSNIIGVLIAVCGALLLCIIGVVLLSGRGANMIAGYNTMSKEKKDKINETALCKAVGSFVLTMGIFAGIVIVFALFSMTWVVYALITFMGISCIFFILFVTKSKKIRKT